MSKGQRNVLLILVGIGLLELSFTGRLAQLLSLATGKITGKANESPPEASRTVNINRQQLKGATG